LCRARYSLLLNPDTIVEEDTFEKCLAFMDATPDAGGLGVQMVDGKGGMLPESKRGLPTPWVAFYKIFGLSKLFPKSRKFGRYHLSFLSPDETHEIDVLSGAFMLLRQAALDKTGLLDEDFFMYGEDIDLSYRITKAGYKNYFFPDTRIIHYKGESTKRASVNYVFVFYKAMDIFAKKHFSPKNAGAFSLLIKSAIYLRAFYALLLRFAWRSYLPIADGVSIWFGLYLLKEWWEVYAKHNETFYPAEYMQMVVPLYALTWMAAAYFNGLYNRPYKLSSVLLTVILGSVIISAGSNFLDEYRYSKALILMGSIYTFGSFALIRLLDNLRCSGKLSFSGTQKRLALVVGSWQESARVVQLIKSSEAPVTVLGWVSTDLVRGNEPLYAGSVKDLSKLCQLFQPDEVIFCAKDINSHRIIEWMTRLGPRGVEFKITPQEADFILGSSSSRQSGELYSLELRLGLVRESSQRRKRLADVALASIMLLGLPFSIWFFKNKMGLVHNIMQVLAGHYTWVTLADPEAIGAPAVRPGVLNTASGHDTTTPTDTHTARRLDLLYAKEYSATNDLNLMLRCFPKLDERAA
jgi:GT2 family glycosyltransferase